MNFMRLHHYVFTIALIGTTPVTNKAMLKQTKRPIQQLKIIKPFFSNTNSITAIRKVMNEIEYKKLGYADYAKRTGLVWSDVLIKNAEQVEIVNEYTTQKVTLVNGILKTHNPQSIQDYPILRSIMCKEILPKMFEKIGVWKKIPENVFAQLFFQRCAFSEAMDWHQDPGEDYDQQADYSLVLMLSEQDDAQEGWVGGEFKIRPGLPDDNSDENNIETIIPYFNQGILFNNQLNSHAVTEIIPKAYTKRDLIVIAMHLTQLPIKKTT